jgi:cytidylate kinase
MIITIDGPTASGKSATAQLLAHELGFYYLNSGLLYRAITYLLMHTKDYNPENLYTMKEQDLCAIINVHLLTYACDKGTNPHVAYNGIDLTPYLKTPEVDKMVPIVSAKPFARQLLLTIQRAIGAKHDLVIDGRDTGSVVFPYAEFKFYLTAPLGVRARRLMYDKQTNGVLISFDEACSQIAERDERDMTRAISPLCVPEGATVVDNGVSSLEETAAILYNKIKLTLTR